MRKYEKLVRFMAIARGINNSLSYAKSFKCPMKRGCIKDELIDLCVSVFSHAMLQSPVCETTVIKCIKVD